MSFKSCSSNTINDWAGLLFGILISQKSSLSSNLISINIHFFYSIFNLLFSRSTFSSRFLTIYSTSYFYSLLSYLTFLLSNLSFSLCFLDLVFFFTFLFAIFHFTFSCFTFSSHVLIHFFFHLFSIYLTILSTFIFHSFLSNQVYIEPNHGYEITITFHGHSSQDERTES